MSIDLDAIMKEMQAEFLKTVDEKYKALEAEWHKQTDVDFEAVKREIHSLKGLGTTFDKPEITALCKTAEDEMPSVDLWLEKGRPFLDTLKKYAD